MRAPIAAAVAPRLFRTCADLFFATRAPIAAAVAPRVLQTCVNLVFATRAPVAVVVAPRLFQTCASLLADKMPRTDSVRDELATIDAKINQIENTLDDLKNLQGDPSAHQKIAWDRLEKKLIELKHERVLQGEPCGNCLYSCSALKILFAFLNP